MKKATLLVLTALILTISCNNVEPKGSNSANDSLTTKRIVSIPITGNISKTTEIDCDTVYKNKGYKITLTTFNTVSDDETKPNTIFVLSKILNEQHLTIFSDSIYNSFQVVRFDDFNNDNVKDILVQNFSDVRSNWTYYLYLVDTAQNKLKKIKGFKEIKNPNYLPQYNIIDNYVSSGTDWTSFYKIQGDTIKDFDIVIYDDHTDTGTYDRDYKKAVNSVNSIIIKEKNKR